MKKEDLQVGDRIINRSAWNMGEATVKEITDRGFKYKLDKRYDLGARYGWFDEGECYLVGPNDLETQYLEKVCEWQKVNKAI